MNCPYPLNSPFSLFSFFPILEREFFGGPEEKIFGSYHLLSFLSTQPNTFPKKKKKKKSFLFSLQSFLSALFHTQTNTLLVPLHPRWIQKPLDNDLYFGSQWKKSVSLF